MKKIIFIVALSAAFFVDAMNRVFLLPAVVFGAVAGAVAMDHKGVQEKRRHLNEERATKARYEELLKMSCDSKIDASEALRSLAAEQALPLKEKSVMQFLFDPRG